MSRNLTRRDVTTQGLLAALGLAIGGGALASDPDTLVHTPAPKLRVKATLTYADLSDEAVLLSGSCLTNVEAEAPRLQLTLEVQNVGKEGVEVLVNDHRVSSTVRVHAMVAGQEEPWMLEVVGTDCRRPQSRALRREKRPLLPESTLVMGTWDVRWPGGLEKAGATVKITSSIGLATGSAALPEQVVAVPSNKAA